MNRPDISLPTVADLSAHLAPQAARAARLWRSVPLDTPPSQYPVSLRSLVADLPGAEESPAWWTRATVRAILDDWQDNADGYAAAESLADTEWVRLLDWAQGRAPGDFPENPATVFDGIRGAQYSAIRELWGRVYCWLRDDFQG